MFLIIDKLYEILQYLDSPFQHLSCDRLANDETGINLKSIP